VALPSLSDVVFTIVLLIPGFIALILCRWIAIFEKELSDSRLVIWSLFMSLVIYGIFGWFTGMTNFDAIRDAMLLPQNLVAILSCSFLLGSISGLIIRVARTRFYGSIVRGDSWDASMTTASKEGSWVIIYTTKGQEYKGALHYSGGKGFSKEVSIRKPKQIFRDSNGNFLEQVEIGKEMLFSGDDIARIAFFQEV